MVTFTAQQVADHNRRVARKGAIITTDEIVPSVNPVFLPQLSKDESKLNKLERARLVCLRLQYKDVGVQDIIVKLADDCRLTVDFNYLREDGRLVMEDVKGFQREDAFLKMKFAARKFNKFVWQIVHRVNGGWTINVLNP